MRTLLRTIEDDGGAMLVHGGLADGDYQAEIRRHFGTAELDRRRVLVCTHEHPEAYLPESITSDDPRTVVIEQPTARSETDISASDAGQPTSRQLTQLREAIDEAIRSIEPSGGFAPGQLRVVIASITGLLEPGPQADISQIQRWIEGVVADVRSEPRNGRLIVAAPYADGVLDRLWDGPISWDVRVELAEDNGTIKNAWTFPASRHRELPETETFRHGRSSDSGRDNA